MRLISFVRNGEASYGIATDDGVIDAGAELRGECPGLRDLLLAGGLDRLRELEGRPADFSLDDIEFLPPVPDPAAKLICVGINYIPHIREMGRERPDYPVLFVRFADSIVGHGQPMIRPLASERFDFEGELAVIVGKRARHVARESALDHVAGYSCFNDGSIRDYQRHGPQWTPGQELSSQRLVRPVDRDNRRSCGPGCASSAHRAERGGRSGRERRRTLLRYSRPDRVLHDLGAT